MQQWAQVYDPLGHAGLSTVVAALPVVVLLGALGLFRARAHVAALLALGVALVVALGPFGMPVSAALAAAGFGAAYGLFPIGWIVLNLIFLYDLSVSRGHFAVLRTSLAQLSPDPRIQVIGIAFCLGAFFEGAAGFGTPVAVTAALLIQLGFTPLAASCLSLIANTAPVAFGALGTPIIALAGRHGTRPPRALGDGRAAASGLLAHRPLLGGGRARGLARDVGVWPAALVAGVAFAVPQYVISNFHGPWLVDVVSAIVSMAALALLLTLVAAARPVDPRRHDGQESEGARLPARAPRGARSWDAWRPWLLLSACVFVWGLPSVKTFLNGISAPRLRGRLPPPGGRARCRRWWRAPRAEEADLHPQLAVGDRHRHPGRGASRGRLHGLLRARDGGRLRAHAEARALLAADDRRDAGARLRQPLLRDRRHAGPRARADRRLLSLLRHAARLAGRRPHRAPTPPPTCSSAACRRSPRSRPASRPC